MTDNRFVLFEKLLYQMEKLADKSVRTEVCKLIDLAKKSDAEALALMKSMSMR